MGGFSIVLIIVLFMTPFLILEAAVKLFVWMVLASIAAYLLYSYIMEAVFLVAARRAAGVRFPRLGWLPFYGQYLLGEAAGSPAMGVILALDHLLAAGLCLIPNLPQEYLLLVASLLLTLVALGFILKSLITHAIYRKAAPGYYNWFTVFSILTLGILRPIFLFALRKKVCMFSKNT